METLKVSSKSVTNSVAGAIAGVIREEGADYNNKCNTKKIDNM